jgi:hypothetical protein
MAERAPSSPAFGSGWLRGWRLTFAGEEFSPDGAQATVVEDGHSSVFVMLYDMTSLDEMALDTWEGLELGLMRKLRVRVSVEDRAELAWLYVLDDFEGGYPSRSYLDLLIMSAQAAGAPVEYLAMLQSHPTT